MCERRYACHSFHQPTSSLIVSPSILGILSALSQPFGPFIGRCNRERAQKRKAELEAARAKNQRRELFGNQQPRRVDEAEAFGVFGCISDRWGDVQH